MAGIKMTVPLAYDTTGIEHFHIPNFRFHCNAMQGIHVAYREFNRSASKTVLIPTCYGGRVNDTEIFRTGALADRHIVVVAMLGNGESSSPSNTPGFPEKLDYRDCVNAQYTLLTEKLGRKHVEAVIGFSMGGQQAYYWAKMYPSYISSVVSICSSAQTSAHNYAFLAGPEAGLLNSSDYPAYVSSGEPPVKGLAAMGRAWVAWAYSPAWYREGHWKETAPTMEEFLVKDADESFLGWDPKDLMVLMEMWKQGNIAKFRDDGNLEKALEEIHVPVLVMPCRTDAYFAWEDSTAEVKHLKKPSRLEVIESVWGHVAGGGGNAEDTKWIDGRIKQWLKEREEDNPGEEHTIAVR